MLILFDPQALKRNVFSTPFGTTVDVIPYVQRDGHTITMTVIPTVTEFLGYDDHQQNISKRPRGEQPIMPLPRFRVRQTTTTTNVLDGQTLVLMNLTDQMVAKLADGSTPVTEFADKKQRRLIVFITPIILDPAGNPVHPAK